jgi:hypothetical protein
LASRIVIGISKGKGFAPISWLIQLVERTPFSHAYVRWHADGLDRDMIYEARGAGVRFVGLPKFLEHNEIVAEYAFMVSDDAKTKLLRWAVDNAGKAYGRKQFVGFGLVRLLKVFGVRIKNPFGDGGAEYVCTELAAVALEELGLLDKIDQDSEGPRELFAQVQALHAEKGVP